MENTTTDSESMQFSRIYKTCTKCNSTFYVSEKDQQYLAANKFALPKKCWTCRAQARREREELRTGQDDSSIDRAWDEKVGRVPSDRSTWETVWNQPAQQDRQQPQKDPQDLPPRLRRRRFL